MAVVLIMAYHQHQQQAKPNNANSSANNNNILCTDSINIKSTTKSHSHQQQQQLVEAKAMFHDFLGMKPSSSTTSATAAAAESPNVLPTTKKAAAAAADASPSASDLASEKHVGNHLEGIPYYGPRSDISGAEISNRLAGSKRSNSDSAFSGSTRDGIPHISHDSLESLHLMKMLKNGGGVERPRRINDDEVLYGMQTMRPTSASLILQPCAGTRLDSNVSKWDQSIAVGTAVRYPPRGAQFVPFTHQTPANRFRDTNVGPSLISQSAADEGSRTGIKGPGILSSINAGTGISDKNSSVVLPSGSRPKSGNQISEPESSTPSSRQGLTSASHQMTIFYAGQAHVFDDVHPNKADVIMALAGSNGGSWSTAYSAKPVVRPGSDACMTSGEYEASVAANTAFQREHRGRLPITASTSQGGGSGDRIPMPIGHHGSIMLNKETRNPVQSGEPSAEEKREA